MSRIKTSDYVAGKYLRSSFGNYRCSELDENRVQVLQVAAPFLLSDNRHTLAEIMVARMMSAEPLVPVNGEDYC